MEGRDKGAIPWELEMEGGRGKGSFICSHSPPSMPSPLTHFCTRTLYLLVYCYPHWFPA